jgi:hypothetical protein
LIVAQADGADEPPPPPGAPYAATFDNFHAQAAPQAGEWNALGGGKVSDLFNWVGNVSPNGASAHARFLGGAEVNADVEIDGIFYTLGKMTFDNANRYRLTGMPLVLEDAAEAEINVLSGSHEIAADLTLSSNLRVSGNGTITIAGASDWTGKSINAAGGTLRLANIGAITNSAASQVSIGAGGTVQLAGAPAPLVVSGLSIAGGATPTGKLDLGASSAIVNYTGDSPAAAIRAAVLAGRGGPGLGAQWNGQGITSSTVADDNMENAEARSIAYAENSALPLGAYTMFKGKAVDDTTVLLAYTRTGDANLDGVVNDDDVTIVGASYAPGVANPHWHFGDFDYNGFVDDDDVTLLGALYDPAATPVPAPSAAGGAQVAAVPEPGCIALVVIAGCVMSATRLRRKVV